MLRITKVKGPAENVNFDFPPGSLPGYLLWIWTHTKKQIKRTTNESVTVSLSHVEITERTESHIANLKNDIRIPFLL